MRTFIASQHRTIEWALGGFVVVSSILVWLYTRELGSLTIYDIFPPLGLIAFGLMWSHFVMGSVRRLGRVNSRGEAYRTISFGIVLGFLILHPGLLWLGLYRDGYGLPPASHIQAYESQVLAVGLGTVGLMIFLAFELRRWFGSKKWWKVVDTAQIVGMAAIFYHAIALGGELNNWWYMAIWWFYGITLVFSIIYNETTKRKRNVAHG